MANNLHRSFQGGVAGGGRELPADLVDLDSRSRTPTNNKNNRKRNNPGGDLPGSCSRVRRTNERPEMNNRSYTGGSWNRSRDYSYCGPAQPRDSHHHRDNERHDDPRRHRRGSSRHERETGRHHNHHEKNDNERERFPSHRGRSRSRERKRWSDDRYRRSTSAERDRSKRSRDDDECSARSPPHRLSRGEIPSHSQRSNSPERSLDEKAHRLRLSPNDGPTPPSNIRSDSNYDEPELQHDDSSRHSHPPTTRRSRSPEGSPQERVRSSNRSPPDCSIEEQDRSPVVISGKRTVAHDLDYVGGGHPPSKDETKFAPRQQHDNSGRSTGCESTQGLEQQPPQYQPIQVEHPNSSIRPDLRIQHGSPRMETYNRQLKPDNIIVVPDFFGREQNMTYYHDLLSAFQEGQTKEEGIKTEFMILKNAQGNKVVNSIRDRMCQYFGVDVDSVTTSVVFRKQTCGKDFRPGLTSFKRPLSEKHNITIQASFGLTRELAFWANTSSDDSCHGVDLSGACVYFPQSNNTVISFGRDVSINWMHGVDQVAKGDGENSKGTIELTLCGWSKDAMEEADALSNVKDDHEIPESMTKTRKLLALIEKFAIDDKPPEFSVNELKSTGFGDAVVKDGPSHENDTMTGGGGGGDDDDEDATVHSGVNACRVGSKDLRKLCSLVARNFSSMYETPANPVPVTSTTEETQDFESSPCLKTGTETMADDENNDDNSGDSVINGTATDLTPSMSVSPSELVPTATTATSDDRRYAECRNLALPRTKLMPNVFDDADAHTVVGNGGTRTSHGDSSGCGSVEPLPFSPDQPVPGSTMTTMALTLHPSFHNPPHGIGPVSEPNIQDNVPVPPYGIGPVYQPNCNDVFLYDRDKRYTFGNAQFRELLKGTNKRFYSISEFQEFGESERSHAAAAIVKTIRSMRPAGRFLRFVEEGEGGVRLAAFYDIGDAKAMVWTTRTLHILSDNIRHMQVPRNGGSSSRQWLSGQYDGPAPTYLRPSYHQAAPPPPPPPQQQQHQQQQQQQQHHHHHHNPGSFWFPPMDPHTAETGTRGFGLMNAPLPRPYYMEDYTETSTWSSSGRSFHPIEGNNTWSGVHSSVNGQAAGRREADASFGSHGYPAAAPSGVRFSVARLAKTATPASFAPPVSVGVRVGTSTTTERTSSGLVGQGNNKKDKASQVNVLPELVVDLTGDDDTELQEMADL